MHPAPTANVEDILRTNPNAENRSASSAHPKCEMDAKDNNSLRRQLCLSRRSLLPTTSHPMAAAAFASSPSPPSSSSSSSSSSEDPENKKSLRTPPKRRADVADGDDARAEANGIISDAVPRAFPMAGGSVPSTIGKTFEDDEESDNEAGGSARQKNAKRRRRASLLDEFNSFCRLGGGSCGGSSSIGSSSGGSAGSKLNRRSFPRAA